MTKVYKINGKEIPQAGTWQNERGVGANGAEYVLNLLLEALDEKKEEPKPQCVKENGYFVCYCGKCEPDNYPLPADFPKQPKSTLREAVVDELWKVKQREQSVREGADTIISLFKDTLLKEMTKVHSNWSFEGNNPVEREDIINLIKNL